MIFVIAICFAEFNNDFINSLDDNAISTLNYVERVDVYDKLKMDRIFPIILSSLIGFGTGSFLHNDYIGGSFCFISDALSIGILVSGIISVNSSGDFKTGQSLIIGAGIGYIVSKAINIILPNINASNYNHKLQIKPGIIQ